MAQRGRPGTTTGPKETKAGSYRHPEAESPARPEAGTQAQFKKKKAPARYRYDSSLSPVLEWDGQNTARELGEWLLACIKDAAGLPAPHVFESLREFTLNDGSVAETVRGLDEAVEKLAAMARPFLDWTGKAERLSFDVPTLPLFVHERLSTAGIIETLKSHKTDRYVQNDLFSDPQHSIADQVLRSYEYKDKWVNRMVLGDSLVVMNSLAHYEGMGSQVQMIYMDPPYGVKFGSNFQPFVRRRDVSHNDDDDMTREPEMVKAYRDTWELGLHSYLTYMRDRLLLARELLTQSGSIFVQISDENLHHVRELMDEVFGAENFISIITFYKTTGQSSTILPQTKDFLIWYARDIEQLKFRQLFVAKDLSDAIKTAYDWIELTDGSRRPMTKADRDNLEELTSQGAKVCALSALTSSGALQSEEVDFEFAGLKWRPPSGSHWKTATGGLEKLKAAKRLDVKGKSLRYVRYFADFPAYNLDDIWIDVAFGGFVSEDKLYVVQTATRVIERCILMTTDPGDLVLDPTCGSGTTAYVAEQWGRRWITIDTSRVPLALARQRILTATFPWYALKEEERGPVGGFVYKRRQNNKGEEVGGIVPHVTLKSIANDESPQEEVLVDRPEVKPGIVRVSGPFVVEATIPTPTEMEGEADAETSGSSEDHGTFIDRMLEVLRRSPVLHVGGGKQVQLGNIRPPAKSMSLNAEAFVEATAEGQKPSFDEAIRESEEKNLHMLPLSLKPVAIIFGPENGAVSERSVYEAARESHAKNYSHLYVIGFAIQPNARKLVEECEAAMGVAATYVQATPDLMMGDLLKNMRSSQIFSVCGLPDVAIKLVASDKPGEPQRYQVELRGLDVFDPSTMETTPLAANDVPAWFLDRDYNDLCFHVSQAFFPRTSAWEGLKKALKGSYEESVWDHLAGTTSSAFEAGDYGKIAVKVIDDRGNELMVVKSLAEAVK